MKIADLRNQPIEVRRILTDAKEGIVDALLNRTWQRSSGSGQEGEIVYGAKPSMKFVSGFLLPRFEETGLEDETSDIHISTLGLDFQVTNVASGSMDIQVTFSIYIRALPSWEEITAEENGIFPRPPLRKAIEGAVTTETRSRIAAMRLEDRAKKDDEKRDLRALQQEIYRSLLAAQGVRVSTNEVLTENPEGDLRSEEAPPLARGEEEPRLTPNKGHYIFDSDAAAQPLDIPEKWRRIEVNLEPCSVDLGSIEKCGESTEIWSGKLTDAVSAALSSWLVTQEGHELAYRPAQILPSNVKSSDAWGLFIARLRETPPSLIDLLPDLQGLRLFAEVATDLRDPNRLNVRVLFENNAREVTSRKRERFEHAVHQVGVSVTLPAGAHRPLVLDRVEPSYRFRDFLSYAAIGVNCGVAASPDSDRLRLTTTWMPRYTQPRIVPNEISGLPTSFAELSADSFDPDTLRTLISAYRKWIQNESSTLDPAEGVDDKDSADRERNRFSEDLARYEVEVERIALGIDLLVHSSRQYRLDGSSREGIPYRAWLLLNRTFLKAGHEKGITSWRLFQMAFILAHVPTLASRMTEYASAEWFDEAFDEETATLLYFPTGGGKSEAFFGLLVFNLFFDRLRGKLLGVTALMRYPLRLLTLQQAQRLLKILIHAEFVRREQHVGGSTFEIGFWVGNANTPNKADDSRLDPVPRVKWGQYGSDDKATAEYDEVNKSFNKVTTCPSCKCMTGLRRIRFQTAEEIAIVCFNPECKWNQETNSQPLPFLIVDSDIYRHAPAVILGVIDKLALIGQHPSTISRVMSMFGLAKWAEDGTNHLVMPKREDLKTGAAQHGCQEVRPCFQEGRELFVDPFPSLVIQDEAHLLEESLGTFAGLFETLLEELFVRSATLLGDRVARRPFGDRTPRLPKVIAATATVSVPQQQFGALYQRNHMHFPYPGTSIYRSFYSVPAEPSRVERRGMAAGSPLAPEVEAPWMRLYVSLMTNGRNHTVTTVSVLSAYHLAITELWEDLQAVDRQKAAVQTLLDCLSEGPLRNLHVEAISYLAEHDLSLLLTLIDLMRISITYVTNKKGGDQVIDAFRDEVVKIHLSHGRMLQQLQTSLISGGVDVAEIQSIMRDAEGQNSPGDEFPNLEHTLRNIVATSAISHGVDVDNFNAMFFAGMPNDIAEFIQASSRVGRSHVGFCLLIPTPHARRDRYIVETHDIFHRFLERMIAPPAITRWAAAAHDRVLSSIFQAWLCGWIELALFVRAKDAEKERSLTFQSVNDVNRLLVGNDYPKAVSDFMDFAVAALGVHGRGFKKIGASPRPDFYESRTRNQAKHLIEEFRRLYTTTRLGDYWKTAGFARPPMTSLRDIDESARFVLSREYGPKSGTAEDQKRILRSALRIVRNQSGRVAELDDDEDWTE